MTPTMPSNETSTSRRHGVAPDVVGRHPMPQAAKNRATSLPGILMPAIMVLLALAGCAADPRKGLPVVAETWLSESTPDENVDSVASWRTPEGKMLLIATAKATDVLRVYDGETGRFLRSIGRTGAAPGEFRRPNGIFVADDFAFVVERDNRRVQVIDLLRNEPVGLFGAGELRYPYGLWIRPQGQGVYRVYVTDNYETADERVPPMAELGERVKLYEVRIADGRLTSQLIKRFGATGGDGVLNIVESIWGDAEHGRLLIADENMPENNNVKVYDLDGAYTGTTFGAGLFNYEPEGIALVDCGGGDGYWLISDQHTPKQVFRLFDRRTFAHVGSFAPAQTHTVDGIWFQPGRFGPFAGGALYSQHDDAAVVAIDWAAIASALSLRSDCGR